MASKQIQFFALPDEVRAWLDELASSGRYKFACHFWPPSLAFYDRVTVDRLSPDSFWPNRLYIAAFDVEPITEAEVKEPGKHVIVQLDLPRQSDRMLQIAELGAKSDWWDSVDETLYENPATIQLYKEVAKQFRQTLRWGLTGMTIKHGGKGHYYKSMGYTDAAQNYAASGVRLKQELGDSVEFFCGNIV